MSSGSIDVSNPGRRLVEQHEGLPLNFLDHPNDLEPGLEGRIGRRGDGYYLDVHKKLTPGAMAVVFLATEKSLVPGTQTWASRKVVVKVIRANLASDPLILQRFVRELEALHEIPSQFIVTAHRVSEWKNLPYFVMEYLDGGDLTAWRRQFDKSPRHAELVRVLIAVTSGLRDMHLKGRKHRDLKPANVLWNRTEDLFKVGDLGLVKHERPGQPQTHIPGRPFGSVGYIPPEQFDGEEPGIRGDLYSLGCLAYFLASGDAPFQDEVANRRARPMPLRGREPPLPEPLVKLIEKLMARKPRMRPASASEVLKELEELQMQPATPAPRPRARFLPRVAAIAVAAGLVVVAMAWALRDRLQQLLAMDPNTKSRVSEVPGHHAAPPPGPAQKDLGTVTVQRPVQSEASVPVPPKRVEPPDDGKLFGPRPGDPSEPPTDLANVEAATDAASPGRPVLSLVDLNPDPKFLMGDIGDIQTSGAGGSIQYAVSFEGRAPHFWDKQFVAPDDHPGTLAIRSDKHAGFVGALWLAKGSRTPGQRWWEQEDAGRDLRRIRPTHVTWDVSVSDVEPKEASVRVEFFLGVEDRWVWVPEQDNPDRARKVDIKRPDSLGRLTLAVDNQTFKDGESRTLRAQFPTREDAKLSNVRGLFGWSITAPTSPVSGAATALRFTISNVRYIREDPTHDSSRDQTQPRTEPAPSPAAGTP